MIIWDELKYQWYCTLCKLYVGSVHNLFKKPIRCCYCTLEDGDSNQIKTIKRRLDSIKIKHRKVLKGIKR